MTGAPWGARRPVAVSRARSGWSPAAKTAVVERAMTRPRARTRSRHRPGPDARAVTAMGFASRPGARRTEIVGGRAAPPKAGSRANAGVVADTAASEMAWVRPRSVCSTTLVAPGSTSEPSARASAWPGTNAFWRREASPRIGPVVVVPPPNTSGACATEPTMRPAVVTRAVRSTGVSSVEAGANGPTTMSPPRGARSSSAGPSPSVRGMTRRTTPPSPNSGSRSPVAV